MNNPLAFRPVQGEEDKILNNNIFPGYIYFATDTGKIYLDTINNERIPIGGSGAAIYYSNEAAFDNLDTTYYEILKSSLENLIDKPKIYDIIFSTVDKSFYRVLDINNDIFYCEILAISGAGGGGVTGETRPSLSIEQLPSNVINNNELKLYFIATSAKDSENNLIDNNLTIEWSLQTKDGVVYETELLDTISGKRNFIDLSNRLRPNTTSKIYLQAFGLNHDKPSRKYELSITSSDLSLEYPSSFSNTVIYNSDNMNFSFNTVGMIPKIISYYFDGSLIVEKELSSSAQSDEISFNSNLGTHGAHQIKVELYQNINGQKGLLADSLNFEIAVVNPLEDSPVIWLGEYKSLYYNYDKIQIPFLVYDKNNLNEVSVNLYKNNVEIDSSPVKITDFKTFYIWEIADADNNQYNYYQIKRGKTEREIVFEVQQDPNRKMELVKQEQLIFNFDPKGRTNNESETKRKIWSYVSKKNSSEKIMYANFKNFNWYNNGWLKDNDNNTVLRISNGASLEIPMEYMGFGGQTAEDSSNSFEIQFKVKNIQKYSNLIQNITRYKNDDSYYEAFIKQFKYNNYDTYLHSILSGEEYDNLEFQEIQKNININDIICGFYTSSFNEETKKQEVTGVCIGTQDAFFSNGVNTVNVSFVEDQIISLSFIYSKSSSSIYIYLNGVITGVIKSSIENFSINSNKIIFKSNICDIDLYKLRVYSTELNLKDILTNYSVDKRDVDLFDQQILAVEARTLGEYQIDFNKIEEFNNSEENPDQYTMPYIIFDTSKTSDNKLPYRKDQDKVSISVEFVNTGLEKAYKRGELEELAIEDKLCQKNSSPEEKAEAVKKYYKYHCPSWIGDNIEISVQGTSSEFYPRRNYKIKSKTFDADNEERIHIFLNKGPFKDSYDKDLNDLSAGNISLGEEESRQKYWYMNNYTNGITKWTMKVDYMESSGSYNAGFAGLVGNAYSKHPLEDYLSCGALNSKDKNGKTVQDLLKDSRGILNWKDYRTSLLGFPVMAFQKKGKDEYIFIGYYRMLLDKGSNEVLGFKPSKSITQNFLNNKVLRDVAECWEFSTNARTFCSFKDPKNRVQLSFKMPSGDSNEFTSDGGPQVANHFEYRYHSKDDYLDLLYKFDRLDDKKKEEIQKEFNLETIPTKEEAQDLTLSLYKNWEKACQWVWSTNLENVASQGTYNEIKLGKIVYAPNKFYYLKFDLELDQNRYILATNEEFGKDNENNPYNGIYYEQIFENNSIIYKNAYVVENENFIYQPNKFYKKINNSFSLVGDENFNEDIIYYNFSSIPEEELKNHFDLLIKPADRWDENTTYYKYNPNATIRINAPTGAVIEIGKITEEEFNSDIYYIENPTIYNGIEFKYDTQEYRTAKFINELSNHFNPEYLATYFVMTEVFECYDSRGKNCMMASWGPQDYKKDSDGNYILNEEGQKIPGEYIWYPIFYDIDTQLGINNTGIPSFEFNVDATEENNFSTSDSILWNNFYKFFKNSYILAKYKQLRGFSQPIFSSIQNPPLQDTNYIENWYTFNPITTNNIAARGIRPLIATNLDLYFKYITITKPQSIELGVAYLDGDGNYAVDSNGTYFYALQGDRSQSRYQFISNRLNYIDSWLGQGNYARAGKNRVRGRISANNPSTTSDEWIETEEKSYWLDSSKTQKRNKFDAEYWLNLTPIYSLYVTAGDDNANYAPQKSNGIDPVKYELSSIETGIRRSLNYPEQLVYIYGLGQMSDLGDMSNLYWREFYIEGEAPKLTSLKLGYDGLDNNNKSWYNKKLNAINLPLSLPLLKEVNISNISLSTDTSLNLSLSEKLENVRATKTSNLNEIKFADGVALNTLYLPSGIKKLKLVKADQLTNLIKEYQVPIEINNNLVANQGLYLDGFFSEPYSSSLESIYIEKGNLGYYTCEIFNKFFEQKQNSLNADITLLDVDWSPFKLLVDGDTYDENKKDLYYLDDEHNGFILYNEEYNENKFNNYILNKKIYLYDDQNWNINNTLNIYSKLSNDRNIKINLSGNIYIDNSEGNSIDEVDIFNLNYNKYPNLNIFCKKINKAYSAYFIEIDEKTGEEKLVQVNEKPLIQKISSSAERKQFDQPEVPIKDHYDFDGWTLNGEKITEWPYEISDLDNYTYKFYANYKKHTYNITFILGDSENEIKQIQFGDNIQLPDSVPYKDDSDLDFYDCYNFIGYSRTENGPIVDVEKIKATKDETFYAVFVEKNVYEQDINYNNFRFTETQYIENSSNTGTNLYNINSGYQIDLVKNIKGKITIPEYYNEKPVIMMGDSFNLNGKNITHVFFQNHNLNFRKFNYSCFRNSQSLRFVEIPDNTRVIDGYAFYYCKQLELKNLDLGLDKNLYLIGEYAFNQAFSVESEAVDLTLSSTIKNLGSYSLSNFQTKINNLQIGAPGKKSNLVISSVYQNVFVQNNSIHKVILYKDGLENTTFKSWFNQVDQWEFIST